jgi:hypothetical protein
MARMNEKELLSYLSVPFNFVERPAPILPRHRLAWGISLVLLFLSLCSRGGKSTLQRLHVLNWAVRNETNRQQFLDYLAGQVAVTAILVRYEPSLNRAVDYAVGEGLVELDGAGRIRITAAGERLATEIVGQELALNEEIAFLRTLRYAMTEQMVTRLTTAA